MILSRTGNDTAGYKLAVITIAVVAQLSLSRDVRPSDHGLPFQKEHPENLTEMTTFFRGSSSVPPSDGFVSPKAAVNSTDSVWSPEKERSRSRVRLVILVASLICGITGVAFLVTAAFTHALRSRRQKSRSALPEA